MIDFNANCSIFNCSYNVLTIDESFSIFAEEILYSFTYCISSILLNYF